MFPQLANAFAVADGDRELQTVAPFQHPLQPVLPANVTLLLALEEPNVLVTKSHV